MQVEQYVMAYSVEHDRLRAIIPEGFISIRPVLRINAEIRNGSESYVELNTAIERDGNRGWLNIARWTDIPFEKRGKTTTFKSAFLEISFKRVGIEGACPAQNDNAGCYFIDEAIRLEAPELITANKEYCDCEFRWTFDVSNAHGVSIGKTLPAYPSEVKKTYPKAELTAQNAAKLPCEQVLGTYAVDFIR